MRTTETTTDYQDTSGDPYAIPANRVAPDQPVSTRKADLISTLGTLLAIVTALPADDFPDLYLTASTLRAPHDWSVQVCDHGREEADRRAAVDRIAAIAGLPAPEESIGSYRSTAECTSKVYARVDHRTVGAA